MITFSEEERNHPFNIYAVVIIKVESMCETIAVCIMKAVHTHTYIYIYLEGCIYNYLFLEHKTGFIFFANLGTHDYRTSNG